MADQIRYIFLSRSFTMIALMFVKGFDPISVTEALRAFPLWSMIDLDPTSSTPPS
jgi:hypothetical protein